MISLPFEILLNIFSQLETKRDKLACLLVCKKWYQPAFESLYTEIRINTLWSFQSFLNIIAHDDQIPGKHVKKIELYRLQRCRQFCLTSAELTVLARNCMNLNEFLFDNDSQWEILNKLDFSHYWKRLHKIPFINNGNPVCLNVCYQLEDRLTDLSLSGFTNIYDICTLLARLPHLQYLVINGSLQLTLNEDMLTKIHRSAPLLKHLQLDTNIKLLADNHHQAIQSTKINGSDNKNKLESLQCDILGPQSAWFPIINLYYNNLHTLSLNLFDPYIPGVMSDKRTLSREESMATVNSLFDLIKDTRMSIEQLKIRFEQFTTSFDFIRYFTSCIVNEYNAKLNKSNKTSISVNCSFLSYSSAFVEFLGPKSCFQSRTAIRARKAKEQKIVHEFNYEFVLLKRLKNDYQDEVDILTAIIATPLCLFTTRLRLKMELQCFEYHVSRSFFQDLLTIFEHFPQLVELSLDCRYYQHKFNHHEKTVDKQYLSLNTLYIVNSALDLDHYCHLFNLCPNISSLHLKDWSFERYNFYSLERLCKNHNVQLFTKKK